MVSIQLNHSGYGGMNAMLNTGAPEAALSTLKRAMPMPPEVASAGHGHKAAKRTVSCTSVGCSKDECALQEECTGSTIRAPNRAAGAQWKQPQQTQSHESDALQALAHFAAVHQEAAQPSPPQRENEPLDASTACCRPARPLSDSAHKDRHGAQLVSGVGPLFWLVVGCLSAVSDN